MGMCARSVVVVAGSGQLCLRATSLPPYDGPHMSMNLHTARFLVAFLLYLYERFCVWLARRCKRL